MAKSADPESQSDQLKRINSLESRRSFLKKAGIGTIGAAALWAAPQMTSVYSKRAYASITGANPQRCVVLFDEDTIDPGMYSLATNWPSIEEIAAAHGMTSSNLVNETGNPFPPAAPSGILPPPPADNWLEWNRNHTESPNRVLLPGGQVNDEGVFTLPNATPQFLTNFMNGNVTYGQLDGIDVCPLRNNSLRSLIGMDCIGVVYDDDINVGDPKTDNLNKEISGLFRFRVLGVLRPGNGSGSETRGIHNNAGSSSSLMSLWMEVLPCVDDFTNLVSAPSLDGNEPPDSISVDNMSFNGTHIIIDAKSDMAPAAQLNVSIGITGELEDQGDWPFAMSHDSGDLYRATIPATSASEINGKVVLLSSSKGGSEVVDGSV